MPDRRHVLSADARALMAFQAKKRSVGVSYVFWLFLGSFGAHRFYNGRMASGFFQAILSVLGWITLLVGIGVLILIPVGIWVIVDAFLIPSWVSTYNGQLMAQLDSVASAVEAGVSGGHSNPTASSGDNPWAAEIVSPPQTQTASQEGPAQNSALADRTGKLPDAPGETSGSKAWLPAIVVLGILFLAVVGVLMFRNSSNKQPSTESATAADGGSSPQVSAETTAPPPQLRVPAEEAAFVNAVASSRTAYETADNDLKKSAVRRQRDEAVLSGGGNFTNWLGTIGALTTNHDGNAIVSISIDGCKCTIETWNNALSDVTDDTLIPNGSDLYNRISTMKTGQRVRISGQMIREASLTEAGSIGEPAWIAKFSDIRANDAADTVPSQPLPSPAAEPNPAIQPSNTDTESASPAAPDATAPLPQVGAEPQTQASVATPVTHIQPSFDCATVTSAAENLICASAEIAEMDVRMAALYGQALSKVNDPNVLRSEQRDWLMHRNACADSGCLMAAYSTRMAELQRWVTPSTAISSVPQQTPQPATSSRPGQSTYWYYCSNPPGYYPYVPRCYQPWRPVPAVVPPTGQVPQRLASPPPSP